jgi:hypothetical protein
MTDKNTDQLLLSQDVQSLNTLPSPGLLKINNLRAFELI